MESVNASKKSKTTNAPTVRPPSTKVKRGNTTYYTHYKPRQLTSGITVYHKHTTVYFDKKAEKSIEREKKKAVDECTKQIKKSLSSLSLDALEQIHKILNNNQPDRVINLPRLVC